jgi:hypothetical protein
MAVSKQLFMLGESVTRDGDDRLLNRNCRSRAVHRGVWPA